MVSKTLARRRKKAKQAEAAKEGTEPKHVTAPVRGHMACGKLVRMRHGLKKKRKYRIGTSTAYDIYENQDRPIGDVNCDSARAALAEAARRKADTQMADAPGTTAAGGAVLQGKTTTKKVVKRVVKKKVVKG